VCECVCNCLLATMFSRGRRLLRASEAVACGNTRRRRPQKQGVHMKGFAPSLELMLRYRVLLAPLRAGAGLKGKVNCSMRCLRPCTAASACAQ
jgi:hypothetical protein